MSVEFKWRWHFPTAYSIILFLLYCRTVEVTIHSKLIWKKWAEKNVWNYYLTFLLNSYTKIQTSFHFRIFNSTKRVQPIRAKGRKECNESNFTYKLEWGSNCCSSVVSFHCFVFKMLFEIWYSSKEGSRAWFWCHCFVVSFRVNSKCSIDKRSILFGNSPEATIKHQRKQTSSIQRNCLATKSNSTINSNIFTAEFARYWVGQYKNCKSECAF